MPGPGTETQALVLRSMLRIPAVVFLVGMLGFFLRDVVAANAVNWPLKAALIGLMVAGTLMLFSLKTLSFAWLRILEWLLVGCMLAFLMLDAHPILEASLSALDPGLAPGAWVGVVLKSVLVLTAYCVFVPNDWKQALPLVVLIAATPLASGALAGSRHPGQMHAVMLLAGGEILDTVILLVAAVFMGLVAIKLIAYFRDQAIEARGKFMYDLVRPIGSGGMGEVWLGKHHMLSRPVAIKWIRPDALEHHDKQRARLAVQSFVVEADATAMLRSPHTIEVFDFGVTRNGIFYYAMEFLEGLDLETLVTRFGPVEPGRTVHYLRQACTSLAEAHHRGLIHRDIKPANLFAARLGLVHDHLKVLDFGLVKPDELHPTEAKMSHDDLVKGTPAYMAPEMVTGSGEVDDRVDIYAIGCVAYWLLTAKMVFEAPTPMAVAVAHAVEKPVPPSRRTEITVPPKLEGWVLKCLEKNPAQRFQKVEELYEALGSCEHCGEWTPERAAAWWQVHLPEKS